MLNDDALGIKHRTEGLVWKLNSSIVNTCTVASEACPQRYSAIAPVSGDLYSVDHNVMRTGIDKDARLTAYGFQPFQDDVASGNHHRKEIARGAGLCHRIRAGEIINCVAGCGAGLVGEQHMLACGSTAVSEIGRTAGGGVCRSPGCKRCSRGGRFAPRGRTITLSIGNNMVEPRGGTIARACADLEDILSIRLQIYHASASAVRMQWRAGAVITAVIPERMPLRPNE